MVLKMFQKSKISIDSSVLKTTLYGFAIGDALGVPHEFKFRLYLSQRPITTLDGHGTHDQPLGTWSDDTSLTLALLHAFKNGRLDLTQLGQNCLDWMQEGRFAIDSTLFDIGNTTRRSLERLSQGVPPLEAGGRESKDCGNGSLMRIFPLAFYLKEEPSLKKRQKIIHQVSSLTHRHLRTRIGCHFYVEYLIQLLKGESPLMAYQLANEFIQEAYRDRVYQTELLAFERLLQGQLLHCQESDIVSNGYVVHTLEAALWCFLTTTSYSDCVLKAVQLGEDTDTIAAIAGSFAAIHYGWESIPSDWIEQLRGKPLLEDGIHAFLSSLDA